MTDPIRLLIHGASGRMGRALLRLAADDGRLAVVAAVSSSEEPIAETGKTPVFSAARLDSVPAFDVAIDFSLPAAFDAIAGLCTRRQAALVSGTTGLSAAQFEMLDAAARSIPLVWAANFSLGVAVLGDLVRRAAATLAEWDCDIVESHHIHKRDAPSGTALALGAAVEQGGHRAPHYASLRAGDIIGEHTVQFTGVGERLELTHRANHRDLFARGALQVACAVAALAPGRYSVADLVLRLKN